MFIDTSTNAQVMMFSGDDNFAFVVQADKDAPEHFSIWLLPDAPQTAPIAPPDELLFSWRGNAMAAWHTNNQINIYNVGSTARHYSKTIIWA